jgi:Ca2+-binding RTX toxin-like protein
MPTTTVPRLLIISTAAMATILAGTGPARAASAAGTVSVQGSSLTFRAGGDVANDVEVFSTLDRILALIDHAAPVTLASSARGRCTLDGAIVRCTGISSVTVELGNRNDNLHAEGYARLRATGGSGNDNLEAGSYQEQVTFQGNGGNDVLIGGVRNDRLEAGSGRNQRTEGNGGRDVCTGSDIVKISCEA